MEHYKGRHIGCAPGTHHTLTLLVDRNVNDRESVLDFGAHSGALLERLRDIGFLNLTGADLDNTRFDVPGGCFLKVDLNGPFEECISARYSLITATDVIEHLNSPREFLTRARNLLKDDGYIGISLPNIAFWEGRMKFMLTGEHWGFGERNYRSQRHISPVTKEQMFLMMQEIGLQVVACKTAGSFSTWLRRLIFAPLYLPIRLFGGPWTFGESAIYLAKKVAPDSNLEMPTHYVDRWQGIPDRIGLDVTSA